MSRFVKTSWFVPPFAALCMAITPVPCTAQEEGAAEKEAKLPAAEEILDQFVEATGGQAAYDKIKNRVTKTTMEIQGMKMSMTTYAAKPNKLYTLMESELMGKNESGCDGKVVWENSAMGGPVIKEGVEKASSLCLATFDRMAYWRKAYEKAEVQGIEEVKGAPCYKIQLFPKPLKGPKQDGSQKMAPHTVFINQDSHLLDRFDLEVENPMGKISLQSYMEDYRKVDGILMPQKLRMEIMGTERLIVTESVKHNVEMPEGRFDLPEEIRELLDRKADKE